MRLVHVLPSGEVQMVVGLLPTCIGMNLALLKQLQDALQPLTSPLPLEKDLDELSLRAEALIVARFPEVEGLGDLLKAIRGVRLEPSR